jgi:hypothetical protein
MHLVWTWLDRFAVGPGSNSGQKKNPHSAERAHTMVINAPSVVRGKIENQDIDGIYPSRHELEP